jgi:hypothetical protein
MCAVTVRFIKPGSYEAFREAWEPDPWPAALQRVVVSRNDQDPDQILTASYLDLDAETLEAARDDTGVLAAEEARLRRVAERVDQIVFKGVFHVVEDLAAPHQLGELPSRSVNDR